MTDLDTLIESAVTDAIAAGEGKIIGRYVREALEKAGLSLIQIELGRPEILLSEAANLCARGRKLDEMAEEVLSGKEGRPRSGTIPLWASQAYERDLEAWEQKAVAYLRARRHC